MKESDLTQMFNRIAGSLDYAELRDGIFYFLHRYVVIKPSKKKAKSPEAYAKALTRYPVFQLNSLEYVLGNYCTSFCIHTILELIEYVHSLY